MRKNINKKIILNLGEHPFADTFIKRKELKKREAIYPLKVCLNKKTAFIETYFKTSALKRYNSYDYSYTSSNSSFSRSHWDTFCKNVLKNITNKKKMKIYEIGSNDGYLLNNFKKFGHTVLGIDASKFMSHISNKSNIKTECLIFDYNSSLKIKKKYGLADVVIANNVLNHSNKPKLFLKGVNNILNDDGVFIFEVPYWLSTIQSHRFDQIYHEHITYFTVKMAFNLLKSNNFEITKLQIVNYHGGSLRIYAKKNSNSKLSNKIKIIIKKETKAGLFKFQTYKYYQSFINNKKKKIRKKIIELKKKGFRIVGVGAAAKANTLLNTFELTNKEVDFITENSQYKIGKFTPKSRIPIFSDKVIKNYKKIYALILSWNISKDLKKKLKKINSNIKYIKI
jgi:2-polyprenyl-3-methyl-5-hydroxy-6-metoxy-1,4-benzoquinol methylase